MRHFTPTLFFSLNSPCSMHRDFGTTLTVLSLAKYTQAYKFLAITSMSERAEKFGKMRRRYPASEWSRFLLIVLVKQCVKPNQTVANQKALFLQKVIGKLSHVTKISPKLLDLCLSSTCVIILNMDLLFPTLTVQ